MFENKTCVVIGASHAGVNFAFALRKEGWAGHIILFDKDPELPYHRPPLSKTYLLGDDPIEKSALKSVESYSDANITLKLGVAITNIDSVEKRVTLDDGSAQAYDTLVMATGARPLIPNIEGIEKAQHLFPLRTVADAQNIRKAIALNTDKKIVVLGGGYIGLEIAASLQKFGVASITVLEREERILSRVATPEMARFFHDLHTGHGVEICTSKNVVSIATHEGVNELHCADGSSYQADIIVLGVGIRLNTELAKGIGLDMENGIKVNEKAQTSMAEIYAIGDCTHYYNPHYDRFIRLESVQNAVDQAKVAAATICGKSTVYDTIPWFWSDQYNVKLQMVGLSEGHTETILRHEEGEAAKFSIWYFNGDELLAVDAVNNAKAYVLGMKFIKEGTKVDKSKLRDTTIVLKPKDFLYKSI